MQKLKVTCAITGITYYFKGEYLQKKIHEYGGVDNLLAYFTVKKVHKYLNRGFNVQEIRNILNIKDVSTEVNEQQLLNFYKSTGVLKGPKTPKSFINVTTNTAVRVFIENAKKLLSTRRTQTN